MENLWLDGNRDEVNLSSGTILAAAKKSEYAIISGIPHAVYICRRAVKSLHGIQSSVMEGRASYCYDGRGRICW